eukprot:119561-Pleurochrysis_carterae.AAC.1
MAVFASSARRCYYPGTPYTELAVLADAAAPALLAHLLVPSMCTSATFLRTRTLLTGKRLHAQTGVVGAGCSRLHGMECRDYRPGAVSHAFAR